MWQNCLCSDWYDILTSFFSSGYEIPWWNLCDGFYISKNRFWHILFLLSDSLGNPDVER